MQRDGNDEFQRKLALGREFEKLIAAWLKSRGWRILPVYDYSGLGEDKAPKLEGAAPTPSLIVPDLLTARMGELKWVEVKYKTKADWTRKTSRLETGINLRLWKHYVEVQAVTGVPVWIMFVHEHEQEVRGESIDQLRQDFRVYDGNKMGRGGMVFFAYDELKRLTNLPELRREFGAKAA